MSSSSNEPSKEPPLKRAKTNSLPLPDDIISILSTLKISDALVLQQAFLDFRNQASIEINETRNLASIEILNIQHKSDVAIKEARREVQDVKDQALIQSAAAAEERHAEILSILGEPRGSL
jgi:hypothetical protein